MLLSKHPTLEALEVNQANRTFTFAGKNQRIGIFVFFVTPADSTLNVFFVFINDILRTAHVHGLPELLLVKFFFGHLLLVASEVLDSESHSTQLNGVKLLDFVIVLAVFVFQ